MLFLIIFLIGMAAGAALAYHFAGVAAIKLKLAELERASHKAPPAE